MNLDQSLINALVSRPSEALSVELKRWIDPTSAEGKAKIIKACFALRNRNGGYLVVGFDDKTHQPDKGNEPADIRSAFHPDTIQGLLSNYASEAFEIAVAFSMRDGGRIPGYSSTSGGAGPGCRKTRFSRYKSKNPHSDGISLFSNFSS